MGIKSNFRKIISLLVTTSLLLLSIQIPVAQAAMVSTQSQIQMAQANYDREQLLQLTQTEDARQLLQDLGVAPDQVEQRINNMTQDELTQFNQQVNDMPAGAGIIGVILVVFLVLIVLDLLGTTNIFPVIKPIN